MDDTNAPRQMGRWMTTALVVGGMIGSGIILLPIALAPLGLNAVIGWTVSGAGALCLAYALAILSRKGGAGIQANIAEELGDWPAFVVTFAFWVSVWTANAAMALASASALARLLPVFDSDLAVVALAIAMVVFLQAVNAFGALATGRTAIITTLVKVLPLFAVVAIAATGGSGDRSLGDLASIPVSFDNVATAAALTLYALLGFETATAPVGKVRDPSRTIPRAILVGTAFVAILYLFSTTAVSLILPTDAIVASRAPFADAVGAAWGGIAANGAAFCMAISAFGALNGGVMIAGELGYSMASRRELPSPFARTTARGTPLVAQVAASLLVIGLILLNSGKTTAGLFAFVALLSTSATLWLYLAGCVAASRMGPRLAERLAIAGGVVFVAFAYYGSGMEANLWSLALLGAGVVMRLAMRATTKAAPPA